GRGGVVVDAGGHVGGRGPVGRDRPVRVQGRRDTGGRVRRAYLERSRGTHGRAGRHVRGDVDGVAGARSQADEGARDRRRRDGGTGVTLVVRHVVGGRGGHG